MTLLVQMAFEGRSTDFTSWINIVRILKEKTTKGFLGNNPSTSKPATVSGSGNDVSKILTCSSPSPVDIDFKSHTLEQGREQAETAVALHTRHPRCTSINKAPHEWGKKERERQRRRREATALGLGTEGFPIMWRTHCLVPTAQARLCHAADFSRLEILWLWNKRGSSFLYHTGK